MSLKCAEPFSKKVLIYKVIINKRQKNNNCIHVVDVMLFFNLAEKRERGNVPVFQFPPGTTLVLFLLDLPVQDNEIENTKILVLLI